jgi:hypothetical protein
MDAASAAEVRLEDSIRSSSQKTSNLFDHQVQASRFGWKPFRVRFMKIWTRMTELIKKIWRDPVWSKVISVAILALCGALLAALRHLSIMHFLTLCVPCWALLIALIVAVLLVPYWWREVRKKKPEIYVAWHDSAGWGIGGIWNDSGMEQVLRLQGQVVISSSHLRESVTINRVELRGAEYAGPYFQMFQVAPGDTTTHTLSYNFRGFIPERGKAFDANLTFIDIKGSRYPLKPTTLRAFPGPTLFPEVPTPAQLHNNDSLVISSPDQFSLRIAKVDSGGIHGIEAQVENDRLTSIHQIRLILSDVSSFDSRHGAFREASVNARTFTRPDMIRPSTSGKPILLVWKSTHSARLVTGENNVLRELLWPDRDKAEIERWKLSLRVQAFASPVNSQEQSPPLGELSTEIIFTWNRARNEFSIETPRGSLMPPVSPAAFPLDDQDGIHREIVRYIMGGPDQLLAYKTTRKGLPGTRLLVVRVRPDNEPQSLETQDRDIVNAKWNEWYQEWKQRGFGGASGSGLDGTPPF